MKNKLIIAVLGLAIIIPSVQFTLAETSVQDTNRATPVIAPISDIDPNATSACTDITRNLRFGMKDTDTLADVSMLQDFLSEKGYLRTQTSGFFGKATFKAVQAFQRANHISPTGYAGPATRAKIKAIDCNGETTTIDNGNEHGNQNGEHNNQNQNSNNQTSVKTEVVRKLYIANEKGQIAECENNGIITFVAYENANVGGGTARTYDRNGMLIQSQDTPGVHAPVSSVDTANCRTIYLAALNMYNKPGIDVYGVSTTAVNQTQTIKLGEVKKLYKDVKYTMTDNNYTFTITGFYNHPCPANARCDWSGLDVFYKIEPVSGRGVSYIKSEINQSIAGFPFAVTIKNSDYTTYAEITINTIGENVSPNSTNR